MDMINTNQLEKRCCQYIDTFEGEHVSTPAGPYIFIDNGADILAVAHLDTVLEPLMFIKYPGFVTSPVLDDRLGVYILLDVLPKLGLKYDILLTTGEEQCNSTAQYFTPPRQYRWMFEFDRRGTDVVMYQYENGETIEAVESVGAYVGIGSYTDLVDLDHLKCVGFNWGCGYELEHTYSCYVDIKSCEFMIDLFVEFYRKYKDTTFKFEAGYNYYKPIKHWEESYRTYDWTLEECEWCGEQGYLISTEINGTTGNLCEDCVEYLNSQRATSRSVPEVCDWCQLPGHLEDIDVDGTNARLCRNCIVEWDTYKEMEHYG
jgi:hypothetical protein